MQVSNHLHFYVGSYTDQPSSSKGITLVSLDRRTGAVTRGEELYPLTNPSYLAQSSNALYAISEVAQQEGAKLVCMQDKFAHTLPIAGDYPCHLAVSANQKWLAVANYGSGNVCVYSLDSQGIPVELIANLFEQGQGPNRARQLAPHAHQVVFFTQHDGLATVDLGSDAIHFYHFVQGQLELAQSVKLSGGSGPRHLVFNRAEDKAYVVCELSETLVVLNKTDAGWQAGTAIELLPEYENGQAASAIKLSSDERFVYVSCRQQNLISCFELAQGQPKWLSATPSGGEFPRDFTLSGCGEWLLVANQHANTIVSYRRDKTTGAISATGYQCQIDAPVCIIEQQ